MILRRIGGTLAPIQLRVLSLTRSLESTIGGSMKKNTGVPLARREGLVIQELPDEVLIYDRERDKAHCLNQTAALVWKYCDGKTSVADMSRKLARELDSAPIDEKVIWYALDQLSEDH